MPLFSQAEKEDREWVLSFIPMNARQLELRSLPSLPDGSPVRFLLRFVYLLLPAQQFPVDVGDLLEMFLHPVIVLDPVADLFDLIGGHRTAGSMGLVQSDTQIPHRTMALAAGTFAGWITAGQIAFH